MLSTATFRKFLLEQCAYVEGETLLAGVSGGLDSIVLCHLLHACEIPFGIAHVNYALRGDESDEDEKFTAELAKQFKVPFYLQRCTQETFTATGDSSVQSAARKIRYAFFETVCRQHAFHNIAIAHHVDDSIETALLNFARGTGVKGLSGIAPVNGNIIRPLLFTNRIEIKNYAEEHKINWREDSSNETDKYSRNRFRHHLLPYLMSEIPQAYSGFEASFKRLEESEEIIRGAMELWAEKCCVKSATEIKISIETLNTFPKSEFFLLFFLRKNGFKEIQADVVSNLLLAQSGTQVISSTHRLIRDRDFLFLIEKKQDYDSTAEDLFSFSEEKFTGEIPDEDWMAIIDSSTVKLPLLIRTWEAADKLIPFGMKGHRNVSDILNDLKLPLHKKEKAAVILSGEEIVWVPGYRIADKFRITKNTSSVIRLKFNPEKYGN